MVVAAPIWYSTRMPPARPHLTHVARADGMLELEPRDAGPIVGYFCMLRDPDGNSVEFSFGQALGPPARRADRQRRQGSTVTRR